MSNLQKQDGDNLGGYYKLLIADITELTTFPTPIDYEISSDIEVSSLLGDVYELAFTPKTLAPDDGEQNTDKGVSYNHKIKFHHPIDCLVNLQWIEDNKNKQWIAVVYSTNGVKKVFGTPTQPLTLKAKRNTPANYNGLTGWSIELSGLNLNPSLFLTADIVQVIIG